MLKQLSYIILFVCIIGCNPNSNYRNRVSSVKVLQTPVVFDCNKYPEPVESIGIDSTLVRPSVNHYLVGRLFPKEQYVTLIYAIIGDGCYPCIYTYNSDGKPIDTLFIGGGCLDIPLGCFSRYASQIYEDRTFKIIDTTGSFHLDKKDNIIPGTTTGEVTTRKYQLDKEGYFYLFIADTNKIN